MAGFLLTLNFCSFGKSKVQKRNMKKILLFLLTVSGSWLAAQYEGPIPPITTGFGADGTFDVAVVNYDNDYFPTKDISVFYPEGTTSPVPAIFYSHAYGGNDTTYQTDLLRHIASRGYAVVYVPYKTIGISVEGRYATLRDGFVKAANNLPAIIDTTRTGFYGHSFGGGATPGLAYHFFTERAWGDNGKFIYCSAPWYSYELSQADLTNFPSDCNMLAVVYDDDTINEHRMAMDIFRNIGIDDDDKDYVLVRSDTLMDYVYRADHNLPSQRDNGFNALDYYVTFRLIDALAEYTFTGNLDAKKVALGNGGQEQINTVDGLKPLVVTDDPVSAYPSSRYTFICDTSANERRAFCESSVSSVEATHSNVSIFPNPTSDVLRIQGLKSPATSTISIYTMSGQMMLQAENVEEVSVASLPGGLYFVHVRTLKGEVSFKIVKI